jgi:hypothetical protein
MSIDKYLLVWKSTEKTKLRLHMLTDRTYRQNQGAKFWNTTLKRVFSLNANRSSDTACTEMIVAKGKKLKRGESEESEFWLDLTALSGPGMFGRIMCRHHELSKKSAIT